MQIKTQEVFEIGEAVVAAETHVVAEEGEHQGGVGKSLCDDRKVDARDARPEGKPSEHQREQESRHQQHHKHREHKMVEPIPRTKAEPCSSRTP